MIPGPADFALLPHFFDSLLGHGGYLGAQLVQFIS